jgi:hypothetical protein
MHEKESRIVSFQGKVTVEYFGYYFASRLMRMKRLKQLCLARAGVTVVTLLLVTLGLAAAQGDRLIR